VGDWERRIRIATDMHERLGVNRPGAEDREAAKKRVYRLKSQEAELRGAQKKLVQEIELAIHKRQTITVKVGFSCAARDGSSLKP